MDHAYGKNRTGNTHRHHDDWDEVHQQLIEVQQKNAVQKKSLAVSQPEDPDEIEADEIARKVAGGESATVHGTGGILNRKGEGAAETSPEFQSKLDSSKGSGQSLPENVREEMESRMGADLSGVKIHTGGESHTMNEDVNAKAFAHGQDIYFREGEYNPASTSGKELLAHELVHTVQQGAGKVQAKKIQRVDHGTPVEKSVELPDDVASVEILNALGAVTKTIKPDSINGFTFSLDDTYPAGFYVIRFKLIDGSHVHERVNKLPETVVNITVTIKKAEVKVPYSDKYRYDKDKFGTLSDIFKLFPNIETAQIDSNTFLPDIVLMQSAEFKELMNPSLEWQKNYNLSYEEAVYVCRLALTEMRGGSFDWAAGIDKLIRKALITSTSSYEETKRSSRPMADPYKSLYESFNLKIHPDMTDIPEMEKAVKEYAEHLWSVPKAEQNDGHLYVARMNGRMVLKRNKLLTKDKAGLIAMTKMMSVLDDISRGREDIRFENDTDRRILISGFDPFDTDRSNPSGVVALALDGTHLKYKDSDGTEKEALVESVIFPTKYSEFDKGKVEKVFEPYLDPAQKKNIFAVITISQDSNPPLKYHIERHASGHRGGGDENEDIGTTGMMSWENFDGSAVENIISQNLTEYGNDRSIPVEDWHFICAATANKIRALYSAIDFTDCPKMSPKIDTYDEAYKYLYKLVDWLRRKASKQQQKLLPDPVDQSGNLEFYSTTLKLENIPHKEMRGSDHTRIRNFYSYFNSGRIVKKNKAKLKSDATKPGAAVEGSGGNYLSNEIYYRVSALGAKYGRAVPNVHLHIPPVQKDTDNPDNATIVKRVQETIRLIVEAQLKPGK